MSIILNSLVTFRAIAPIYSQLSIRMGVDQFAPAFIKQLKNINLQLDNSAEEGTPQANFRGEFIHLGGQQDEDQEYLSTDKDSKDIRLMCWLPSDASNIVFHLFTNHIAIAEVELEIDITELSSQAENEASLVELIEDKVQKLAKEKIQQHYLHFCQDLTQLSFFLTNNFVLSSPPASMSFSWVARTMVTNKEQLKRKDFQQLITSWLKQTGRPEDAADIISGHKNHSLTWLNYVIKDVQPIGEDPKIQIMVLAQYYYISQENCNKALRGAIESAYSVSTKQKIDKLLSNTRTACRLNQISFFENIKFLNRPNRALLEDILNGWKFDQIVENSERMIEVCNGRLQEEDNKKRERSSLMTDFLLVALSFFAVFELSLYLTEFSREMMSRPALDYNDNRSSLFLSFIAEIDADIMFSLGFGLTLLLILVYRYIKRN